VLARNGAIAEADAGALGPPDDDLPVGGQDLSPRRVEIEHQQR
jgi:hypothetical protein